MDGDSEGDGAIQSPANQRRGQGHRCQAQGFSLLYFGLISLRNLSHFIKDCRTLKEVGVQLIRLMDVTDQDFLYGDDLQ